RCRQLQARRTVTQPSAANATKTQRVTDFAHGDLQGLPQRPFAGRRLFQSTATVGQNQRMPHLLRVNLYAFELTGLVRPPILESCGSLPLAVGHREGDEIIEAQRVPALHFVTFVALW